MMSKRERGFTLIEILIVLLMTAVALMALGTFSVAMMNSGSKSSERLKAVHLAEQVIEEWQNDANDYLPSIASDCTMSVGSAASNPSVGSSVTNTCAYASSPNLVYTIISEVADANAPLPSDLNNFQPMQATATYTNTPVVKLVKVQWNHKGDSPNCDGTIGPIRNCIYLTHLTR